MCRIDVSKASTPPLGQLVRVISTQVWLTVRRKLSGTGISAAEWALLQRIAELGNVRPGDLAAVMGCSPSTVSKQLIGLQGKKLVVQTVERDDLRCKTLSLTAEGRKLVARLNALEDLSGEEVFADLDSEERKQLERLLQKAVETNRRRFTYAL